MLRRAKQKDLEKLLKLLYQLSPSKNGKIIKRQREIFKTILNTNSQEIIVYESNNGALIGTITLLKRENLTHKARPVAYIENVVVDEQYRNKGIGIQLVKKAIKIAKKWNCYKIILTCKPELINFYGKLNFKEFKEIALKLDME